jgi:hypothetical protein
MRKEHPMTSNDDHATALDANDTSDVSGHSLLHEQVFADIAASRSQDVARLTRNESLVRQARATDTQQPASRRRIRRLISGISGGALLALMVLAIA